MTAKIKKEKKSILLENTFLPFGVEMLFSWFIIVLFTMYLHLQTGIEISYIPRDLITVIFYYQISLNPLKTQSLSQVSFPLLFPLRYIVPPVFTNSDKGKNKGKKII